MKCSVCQKGGCKPWERNTDGTYTHAACLHQYAVWPTGRSERGQNFYGEIPRKEEA